MTLQREVSTAKRNDGRRRLRAAAAQARISHQLPAAAGYLQQSAAFAPVGLLHVRSGTSPRPSGRKHHISQHLPGLATIAGEICGLAALLLIVVSLSACSTIKGSSDGTWTASFFTDPDRVWGAIEISLIELDYEVTEKNRFDGVIRARLEPADDGTVIALAIDQVMRTEDQVKVYVKPSFAGDEGSTNPDLLKAAADEFVKTLNSQLNG